jgi:hypothetical protein
MHASDPPENDALRDLPSVVGQLLLLLLFYFIYLFIVCLVGRGIIESTYMQHHYQKRMYQFIILTMMASQSHGSVFQF